MDSCGSRDGIPMWLTRRRTCAKWPCPAQGKQRVEEAVVLLQEHSDGKKIKKDDAERVVLVISSEGIRCEHGLRRQKLLPHVPLTPAAWAVALADRTVEQVSRTVVSSVLISNVSYITEIIGKKTALFAMIYKDERLGRKSCQIYLCESKEVPNRVCEKLKEA